jgi:hypothetical protein
MSIFNSTSVRDAIANTNVRAGNAEEKHLFCSSVKRRLPIRPLADAIIVLFGLANLQAMAAPPVTNCADAGPGSLRQSVLSAANTGDTVDASLLNCTISLTTGAIIVGQDSLTVAGPGRDKLTIDGKDNLSGYNIFFHAGHGTLEVDDVTVSYGHLRSTSETKYLGGGCIFSTGNVTLKNSTVSLCTVYAKGNNPLARGGGVFAQGNVTLSNSLVTYNEAYSEAVYVPFQGETAKPAYGGGVFANGVINVDHSTISFNNASIGTGYTFPQRFSSGGGLYSSLQATVTDSIISYNSAGSGGGIMCHCALTISGSTIENNQAMNAAGLSVGPVKNGAALPATISNSTISGNRAEDLFFEPGIAGLVSSVAIAISNSTIAFNHGSGTAFDEGYTLPAVYVSAALDLTSSIVAENYAGEDLGVAGDAPVSGANNLISAASDALLSALPDTIIACAQLDPLADNGGPTPTHALRSTSPAIDAGSQPPTLVTDQRGSGYPRVFGKQPDIGAFEWQGVLGDTIFRGDLDHAGTSCDL